MSLVHEALQKAEREKQRKTGVAPSAPPPVPAAPPPVHASTVHLPVPLPAVAPLGREPAAEEPAPPAVAPARTNSFLLPTLIACVAVVAIIAVVFLVGNAASVFRQTKEITSARAATPAAKVAESVQPQPAAQPSVGPAAAPSTPPPMATAADESKYKLSGIMTDPDGKYVAVLNGRIAYEGYYIDGATVKKIEHDRITIDDHGHEAVLRLF